MLRKTIKRFWWRILRFFGFVKYSWDKQFEAGMWCKRGRSPHTIKQITEFCKGGKLIEFGCGEGNLPFYLPHGSYSEYIGYDISEVAIKRAKERALNEGVKNIRFKQCDMTKWNETDSASMILVEECLYYLSPKDIIRFLLRCSNSLTDQGIILVIVHSASKHATTLNACRQCCKVLHEKIIESRAYLILAPKDRI